jgi:hypothetical protein
MKMFGETILQFEIHVGMPQKSLIFKVILPPAVGRTLERGRTQRRHRGASGSSAACRKMDIDAANVPSHRVANKISLP